MICRHNGHFTQTNLLQIDLEMHRLGTAIGLRAVLDRHRLTGQPFLPDCSTLFDDTGMGTNLAAVKQQLFLPRRLMMNLKISASCSRWINWRDLLACAEVMIAN